ncbi:B-cell receptor CD22-like [Ischnura elegans]|uniref:B-cell receptor CD22-like n=1 Tax=Ischnura elegans TaxID=197161 RepID=UPI001ED8A31C|nr:B-cell receptor CD22-like [Ischnura elegans]
MGKKGNLPCDINPPDRGDSVYMVLWFKESDGEPLYSFDVRGRQFGQAKLWSAPSAFGTRAFFRTATTPAQLMVDDLTLEDEGVYRCRVDFRNSPTRNLKINLTVIVPPERPVIFDAKRRDRAKVLEPYNEGSDVNLICEVNGGQPRPKLTWFLENTVIDDSYEQRPNGLTVNRLTFPSVGRQHLNARLICQASNTNLTPPAQKLVALNINLKPVAVHILTKEKHVSADKRYEVECKATGSRPEAVITWWKGSRQIKRITKNYSEDGNHSVSILTFVPVIDDDGKYLTCRAENPYIPESALEDKWRLNVQYMPMVSLKMGSSLNPNDIKEGDDVYFECNIKANPKAYKLAWYHEGREIVHNVSAGVILSDQSLVLQGVTRNSAGDYTCLAANTEGKGSSNPVTLRVMFVPTCKEDREELFGALKHETIAVRCEVEANPPIVAFHWTFNNSGGDVTEVPSSWFTSDASVSRLNYTPSSDMDYGTLACWGANEVGRQRNPCVFQVVAAGRPFPLQNCTVSNLTSDSLHVDCLEGFDGGLPQHFLMELLEMPSAALRLNVTSSRVPSFALHGLQLEPGVSFQVVLYAVNAKGRSDPALIDEVTFKGVAKYTGPSTSLPMSPVLTTLVIAAIGLVLLVCGVFMALYRRHRGGGGGRHRPPPPTKRHSAGALVVGDHGTNGRLGGGMAVGGGGLGECTGAGEEGAEEGAGVVLIGGQVLQGNGGGLPLLGVPPATAASDHLSDDADPDVIPNKHERRPLKGFMKIYKTPPQRRRKKKDEAEAECGPTTPLGLSDHLLPPPSAAGDITSGIATLRAHKGVTANYPMDSLPLHKLEITASNRIQESCI